MRHDAAAVAEWATAAGKLARELLVKHGLDVAGVDIALHVRPSEGLVRQLDGSVEKRFSKAALLYPIQVLLDTVFRLCLAALLYPIKMLRGSLFRARVAALLHPIQVLRGSVFRARVAALLHPVKVPYNLGLSVRNAALLCPVHVLPALHWLLSCRRGLVPALVPRLWCCCSCPASKISPWRLLTATTRARTCWVCKRHLQSPELGVRDA